MSVSLKCKCGTTFVASDYAISRGRKYCSPACSQKYRAYGKAPDVLKNTKVAIPLKAEDRAELEAQAEEKGIRFTELGRRYILRGLEDGR